MKKTHKELILEHLKEYGTITSIQAILYFGATRLSQYIYLLRKEGYNIDSVSTKVKSRQGRKTTIATYTLRK